MTTPRKPKADALKLDPNIAQRLASDPLTSAWVTASAGTGKTKVLTDRVLRLMLHGASPDQILCLTFTRAGASVMTNRIREELASWATCDDTTLEGKLAKLSGTAPTDLVLKRARRLFAEFLDAHGGLRIQTIHSFAQSLLRRFPIESGIPPYFDVMDDQSANDTLRWAWAEVLRDTQKDPKGVLAAAVHMITPEVSEDDFASLIGEITYRRGQFLTLIEQHGGLEPTIDAIYDYMKAPRGVTGNMLKEQLVSDNGIDGNGPDIYALEEAAAILSRGSDAEQARAAAILEWTSNPKSRVDLFDEYKKVFLTGEGTLRKKLTTKATQDAEGYLAEEGYRLLEGIEAIATVNVARGTDSILRLTSEILQKYNAKKRSQNLLDYDDLVYQANRMMIADNAAGWVLQKLPGNLKHILVDEAQDTNPDQWQLVSAIAKEFFSGKGQNKKGERSIFVVGDEKQSIFSFQRADPEEFGQCKKFFAELLKKSKAKFRDVQMDIAFRSSPAITDAVDAVFASDKAADGLFFKDEQATKKVKHNPFRVGQAGLVELHPIISGEAKPDTAPWSLPLTREIENDPATEMADKIADQIKGWLDSGEELESKKRPINPADIMILVRRRSDFVEHMVRALKKRDIPVAGADRMSLREQIVVMDLLALGEFLLFPKDDYKLACILKSPLIGINDQQLEDLAIGRTGDLWDALKSKSEDPKADKLYKAAFEYLSQLQTDLNTERPYEFYNSVLMNACPAQQKGLYAMYSRLGFEAEDPLVEFLNAVEKFEKIHIPSLQGFLSWFNAGESEVKRELSLNADRPRVHIMTVHGAKGLESPIVFLPDTTGIPSDNARARPKFLWPTEDRMIPLWVPRADLESKVFTRERELAELEQDREYRRLLYVAMTRAADRLYVYGSQKSGRLSEKSWYALIREGMTGVLADKLEEIDVETGIKTKFNAAADITPPANDNADPEDDVGPLDASEKILRFHVAQTARAKNDGLKPVDKTKAVGIPSWAREAPPADPAPVVKFRPSEYKGVPEQYTAPSPLDGEGEAYDIQLGTVVHQLFEFLPSLPPEERAAAAEKYLAKPVWGIKPADQKSTVRNIIAIIDDPHFGALFGPNSRPEVSITGMFEKNGEKQMMSAQVDRLVVDEKTVTIVDFKNSRRVPKTLDEVQYKYIVQLASYRLALQQIYPDKEVRCALFYTRGAKFMELPNDKLERALAKIGLVPHVKKPTPPKP